MNLFELFVKIGVDDQASGKLGELSSKLGNGLKTAAKIGTAAVGAAAAGITALTTAAVNNYAQYEQLVGGVDTLFKEASQKVQQYAANAYKTAGMSANDYMANATAFSASLISSLGGDTEKAAEYANRAMVSMSDNANKMGSNIDSIVQTYQSLARGNFAMLDNLKLGYGGTKAELERLIKDAASYTDIQKEMGVTVDASSMSFDNIVNAIAVVQGKLGIAGATAQEAGTTIEGSVNSMKAAWNNLITGLADGNADIGKLVDNLVTTIVGDGTESNLGVFGNVMPAVKTALRGASKLVSELLPKIVQEIPLIINDNLPILVGAALSIIQSLSDGIVKSLPELIPTIINVVLQIVKTLTHPDQLNSILEAALVLVTELAYGLMDAIPALVEATFLIIENLISFLLAPENMEMVIGAGLQIVLSIVTGLINAIPQLVTGALKLISNLIKSFVSADWKGVGTNIVNGILNGLKRAWGSLVSWFTNAWDNLVGGVKDLLGIHSPSRVFAGIGKNMALGVGEGWGSEFENIQKNINKSLSFNDASVGINASIKKASSGVGFDYKNTGGGVTVVQNIYSEAKTAADLMREARWEQERAVLMGV